MTDTKMVKTAGEHWTCSMLARHGWAPALTRDGTERTDVLAVSTLLAGRPTAELQVKAATKIGDRTTWPLNEKAQQPARSQHEWFVFVLLPAMPIVPRGFVVPRDHVAAAAWIVHQDWLTSADVPKGRRNAPVSQARARCSVWEGYEDRWDLLGTPTDDVPVLLPSSLQEQAQLDRVGLPPGHPWVTRPPEWSPAE
jgi:hypothetical protein